MPSGMHKWEAAFAMHLMAKQQTVQPQIASLMYVPLT